MHNNLICFINLDNFSKFAGSLLVAAAHYGAYVLGSDIDYPVIHGSSTPSILPLIVWMPSFITEYSYSNVVPPHITRQTQRNVYRQAVAKWGDASCARWGCAIQPATVRLLVALSGRGRRGRLLRSSLLRSLWPWLGSKLTDWWAPASRNILRDHHRSSLRGILLSEIFFLLY